MKRLFFPNKRITEKKKLAKLIRKILGFRPYNLNLYILAAQHTSVAKQNKQGLKESNERLEFLGDAVLGFVVGEYLFRRFPYKDEGFLTEIRARIVKRESLNKLAKKVGVNKLIRYDQESGNIGGSSHKSLLGDTLEAFIGAVYLDRGFKYCKRFILKKLIIPHFDIKQLIKTDTNYKSKVIEWAQKENHEVRFEVINIADNKRFKEFTSEIYVNDEPVGRGIAYNKKRAEQNAAKKACSILNI